MNEITTQNITPEVAKSQIMIALTAAEKSIQLLHDEKDKLVFNEDNLEKIKEYLNNCKKSADIVEAQRNKIGRPHYDQYLAANAGAKVISSEIEGLKNEVYPKYASLCQAIEKRQQEAENDRLRVAGIRQRMNDTKIKFTTKISDAKTSAELVAIERLFNLESANTKQWGEFIDEFRTDCEAIRVHLRQQKEKVRELEELAKQAEKAAANGSDEQILEIMEKKEVLEAQIAEKKINIQEEASAQASKPTQEATIIIPLIPKGGRKLWKYEIVDLKAATKAGLMMLVPDETKIDEILKEKRNSETEVTENGIRYFIQKTF
jgi:hypothetical protein